MSGHRALAKLGACPDFLRPIRLPKLGSMKQTARREKRLAVTRKRTWPMNKPPSEPRLIAEILSVVRALAVVHGIDPAQVPRRLLDLSTRERRTLRRAGLLVDDGRRTVWALKRGP